MLEAFREINVNMSLKIHFLANHLDFFPDNLGAFSDEHGERFHKDIADIENRFEGKDLKHMLSEYCWYVCRHSKPDSYKRKAKKRVFLPDEPQH